MLKNKDLLYLVVDAHRVRKNTSLPSCHSKLSAKMSKSL